jgi:hypothetical protein
MKTKMKEQEIKGNKWTLVFYYPVGKKQLQGKITDNFTQEVVKQGKIKNQEEYNFAIDFFTKADTNWTKNNMVESK